VVEGMWNSHPKYISLEYTKAHQHISFHLLHVCIHIEEDERNSDTANMNPQIKFADIIYKFKENGNQIPYSHILKYFKKYLRLERNSASRRIPSFTL